MSKKETPLIRAYWNKVGGTLVEEFLVVKKTNTNSPRYIDGIIIPDGEHRIAKQREVVIKGKDIICVQAKTKRLGMYLMGQTLFSYFLLQKYFKPRSILSVALCTCDDSVLRPLLERYPYAKVEIIDYF
ncbi:MAG TPA: hypothetical protein VNN20_05085 [Thermodesulfobacteriota bacterium]|nr:hypothetical protein [Thermodesulfobacteriota bacterium]